MIRTTTIMSLVTTNLFARLTSSDEANNQMSERWFSFCRWGWLVGLKATWKPARRNSPQSLFYGGRTVAKKKAAKKKAAPKKKAAKKAPAKKKAAKKAPKKKAAAKKKKK